jgi:hypothetical protein
VDGFESVDYYGAFAAARGNGTRALSWLTGWTALETTDIVQNGTTSVGGVVESGMLLDAPVPNPTSGLTQIRFELPTTSDVTITITDMLGRPVARQTRTYGAGEQTENFDASRLANGTYLVVLDAQGARLLQKMVVQK